MSKVLPIQRFLHIIGLFFQDGKFTNVQLWTIFWSCSLQTDNSPHNCVIHIKVKVTRSRKVPLWELLILASCNPFQANLGYFLVRLWMATGICSTACQVLSEWWSMHMFLLSTKLNTSFKTDRIRVSFKHKIMSQGQTFHLLLQTLWSSSQVF